MILKYNEKFQVTKLNVKGKIGGEHMLRANRYVYI